MRRTRIYHQEKLTSNQTVILSTETSHYLLHVLRKKIGDVFWLFDGSGAEYQAQLIAIEKKHAKVELGEVIFPDVESKLNVHLGQAISRGDRMDYAIQKAVEMGVAQITPLLTDFCQVKLPTTRFEKKWRIGKRLQFLQLSNLGAVLCLKLISHKSSLIGWRKAKQT